MGRLEGRVAFVTGASRGIGAATALRMAEEGARVALADIDTEGCLQVSAELDRLGLESLIVACNVTDGAMVNEAMEQTASRFGRLDILVNNNTWWSRSMGVSSHSLRLLPLAIVARRTIPPPKLACKDLRAP